MKNIELIGLVLAIAVLVAPEWVAVGLLVFGLCDAVVGTINRAGETL